MAYTIQNIVTNTPVRTYMRKTASEQVEYICRRYVTKECRNNCYIILCTRHYAFATLMVYDSTHPLQAFAESLQQEFDNFHILKLPSYTKTYIVYGLVWSLSYLIWRLLKTFGVTRILQNPVPCALKSSRIQPTYLVHPPPCL